MKRDSKYVLFVALAVVMLLCGAACHPGRHYEAALVLADIASGDQPSRLKRSVPAPQRLTVDYLVNGHPRRGDLYRPQKETRAGLLLIPGVAEAGKDDPRLVTFATTLARAGFAVLVPDLPNLRQLRVSPTDVDEVVAAFAWLVADPARAPQGRAGMGAFSYAAGPALLAALDEAIRQQVQFVFAVGGYYDLPQVLTFFTTGYYRLEDQWKYLQPSDYGKWAFVASNIHLLNDVEDRRIFRRLTLRKLTDPAAPVGDLVPGLGSEGRALYAFVTNRDPRRARQLLAALPGAMQADVAALNVAGRDLSRLSARLILIHGLQDPMIPYVQSVALAGASPTGRARLFLVDGLDHVDVAPELPDRWRLWRAVALLLAARDGKF